MEQYFWQILFLCCFSDRLVSRRWVFLTFDVRAHSGVQLFLYPLHLPVCFSSIHSSFPGQKNENGILQMISEDAQLSSYESREFLRQLELDSLQGRPDFTFVKGCFRTKSRRRPDTAFLALLSPVYVPIKLLLPTMHGRDRERSQSCVFLNSPMIRLFLTVTFSPGCFCHTF